MGHDPRLNVRVHIQEQCQEEDPVHSKIAAWLAHNLFTYTFQYQQQKKRERNN